MTGLAKPITHYRFTPHAISAMGRRRLDERLVRQIVAAPEQRHMVRPGRDVLQSCVAFGDRVYLVRVTVDVDRSPAEVVTAYRTRNVAKYWRAET